MKATIARFVDVQLPYDKRKGVYVFEGMTFETLTDSTLQLTTEVMGYYFRISLVPQAKRIDRTLVGPEGEGE